MEADCTAHPFRETNRRSRRASYRRAVVETQTAVGKTGNKFKKWRDNKEKIDRHVRQNEEWHEGDLTFPFKIKRADVRAMHRDAVATAVNDQEQDR